MINNPTPTLRGTRIGAGPSYPRRDYVYNGTEPIVPRKPYGKAECGTTSGYTKHVQAGTEKCQPCKDAMAADSQARRDAERAAEPPARKQFNPDACGTHKGYLRHKYHGLEPCDPCRAANTAYSNDYYRRMGKRAA